MANWGIIYGKVAILTSKIGQQLGKKTFCRCVADNGEGWFCRPEEPRKR
jgi:hypothetical protein